MNETHDSPQLLLCRARRSLLVNCAPQTFASATLRYRKGIQSDRLTYLALIQALVGIWGWCDESSCWWERSKERGKGGNLRLRR